MITSCLGSVFVHLSAQNDANRQVLLWMSGISNWCCIRPWQFSNLWHWFSSELKQQCRYDPDQAPISTFLHQKKPPNSKKKLLKRSLKNFIALKKITLSQDLQTSHLTPNHPHPTRTEVSNVPTSSVMYRWSDGIRPISGSFLSRLWTSLLWMAACLWSVAPWYWGENSHSGSRFGCLDVNGIGSQKKVKVRYKNRCYIKK